ncbi:hypothetical protein PanWU01x14_067460 [Parasponia andersonii]|uniref:Small ribosomal subunit protein mS38 n=1 Tax=Parasponia andersonii TaxID=3476 RepID=A0A2P5DGF3_PARAD|nr:hypothetical protein PanWU01x14_067460 [Parasponia andersonii]
MANLMHKFAKNRPPLRFFTALNTHLVPKSEPSLTSHPTRLSNPKSELIETQIFSTSGDKVELESYQCSQNFPSFPFGYCLNPIPSTGSERFGVGEVEGVETVDARTVWADSVKKKRKKKMNKHKYKKLRKRLRRKART